MNNNILKDIKVQDKIKKKGDHLRLCVYRSNKHFYAQLIDDSSGSTILSADDKELDSKESKTLSPTSRALKLGHLLAKKAIEKKTTTMVFDRNTFRYHGQVKAFAEGARKGGLKF